MTSPEQEILEEVREIREEVKAPSVIGRLVVGSLTGAVVGVLWVYRRGLAGLGRRAVTREP
jgi:hypothetical protein